MIRTTLAVLLGLVVALAAMSVLIFLGLSLFGQGDVHVPSTEEGLADLVASETNAVLVWKLTSWLASTFAGSWTAARISFARRYPAALAVGLLLVAGLVLETTILPYPAWMTVAGVLLPLPVAWAAARLASPRPAAAAAH